MCNRIKFYITLATAVLLACPLVFTAPVIAATAEEMVMPGPVIEGHAKYEKDCEECHKRFDGPAQRKLCMDCHKKVKRDIELFEGYHGRFKPARKIQCRDCHTDHKGRGADIVKLEKTNFKHKFTDFPLKGKHRQTACSSCHKKGKKYREAKKKCFDCHEKDDRHKTGLGKKCEDCHSPVSWLKVSFDHDVNKFKLRGKHRQIACVSCHANERYEDMPMKCVDCHKINDIHKGELGDDCKACHSPKSWKSIGFDHDTETEFPLEGRHKKIKCQACHKKDPREEKLEKDCYSCHKLNDKHQGLFGRKCATCHNPEKWDKIGFDHDKETKFAITGKHKKATCTDCHKKPLYKTKTSMVCYDCHKHDDAHSGKNGKKCGECHVDSGWKDNIVFDHDLTSFPLNGLHSVVACKECHLNRKFSGIKSKCVDCHGKKDSHKRKLGSKCETCHNPNGWRFWRFNHDKQTKFKLKGKHKKVHCHSCHNVPVKDGKPLRTRKTCVSCHEGDDPHEGQFGTNCERCHNEKSFSEVDILR